ncbi:MAG: hypothetical protein IJ443_06850, partial [Firmicutes bacterium]|nr:hypothetical protein [Bacillota bacterium]
YGAAQISGCNVNAELKASGDSGYAIGGIVGALGTTQGDLSVSETGFTGIILVNGEAGSVGGILGLKPSNQATVENGRVVTLNNVYSTGAINVGSVKEGSYVGGIMGNNFAVGEGDAAEVVISNSYWYGSYTNSNGTMDGFGAISANSGGVTASNTYYIDGFNSTVGTAKDDSFFTSGEAAYELDGGSGNRSNVWTQGSGLPGLGQPPVYKVEVAPSEQVTWADGTTATITTTLTSNLGSGSTVFVKEGETVQVDVQGLPADKVVTNSDGSTTTTRYTVTVKDVNGNVLDGTPIVEDLSASGAGSSSDTVTPAGQGSGTGGIIGDGTGDGEGDGQGEGEGEGTGDGEGDGTGEGYDENDGNGGEDQNQSGTDLNGDGTGTSLNPAVNQQQPNAPVTGITPADQAQPTETADEPQQMEEPEPEPESIPANSSGGSEGQGGGDQGQQEKEIYKLVKKVAETIQENPAAVAAVVAGIIAIILFGAWRRKKKEDEEGSQK